MTTKYLCGLFFSAIHIYILQDCIYFFLIVRVKSKKKEAKKAYEVNGDVFH